MASQGIVGAWFAKADQNSGNVLADTTNGLDETGVYFADGHTNATAEGLTQIQLGNLSGTVTPQFANNKQKRASKGEAYPTAQVTFLDIEFNAQQKLLGMDSDGKGGFTPSSVLKPVYALFKTQTLDKQHDIYYALTNCHVTTGNKTLGTNNQNEVDSNDEMTFNSKSPIKDSMFKGKSYKVYSSIDAKFNFDDMMAEVFPGYKKQTTVTPSTNTDGN
ncbi:phage tail protein [Leuconostoc citreum]|uniref:phage tail protein n=1 Tax=Leuconostoc citreum TaxID=33964 RepID=UPI0015DBB5BC|nr:phage tail protein [Leuconostoc citreum]